MALVGGLLDRLRLRHGIISLGSLVGFFTVLGIVARNGIMLISHFQHLEEHEGEPFGPGLVLRGAKERVAPILMTALTTGLALVPLLLAGNIPGQEIEYPMAIVILGGLDHLDAAQPVRRALALPPVRQEQEGEAERRRKLERRCPGAAAGEWRSAILRVHASCVGEHGIGDGARRGCMRRQRRQAPHRNRKVRIRRWGALPTRESTG